ncbi:hypothetical protein D3C84_1184270 [compost metagenome]
MEHQILLQAPASYELVVNHEDNRHSYPSLRFYLYNLHTFLHNSKDLDSMGIHDMTRTNQYAAFLLHASRLG